MRGPPLHALETRDCRGDHRCIGRVREGGEGKGRGERERERERERREKRLLLGASNFIMHCALRQPIREEFPAPKR